MSKLRLTTSFQDQPIEGCNLLLYLDGVWLMDVAQNLGVCEGLPVVVLEEEPLDGYDGLEFDAILVWRGSKSLLGPQLVAVAEEGTYRQCSTAALQ